MILHNLQARHSALAKSKLIEELVLAALRAGDSIEAERLLRGRMFEDPNDVFSLAKLAEILHGRGCETEALLLLKRAARAAPDMIDIQIALARQFELQGEYGQALAVVENLAPSGRSRPEIRAIEAALAGTLGRHDQEIATYQELVEQFPDHAPLWMSFGNALKTIGRLADAVEALRRATVLRPQYGEAWWSLANLKTFYFTDRDLSAMRKALRSKLTDDDALHFHFALGKALEGRGDLAASFRHYSAGNSLRSVGLRPDQTSVSRFVNSAIATFDRQLFDDREGAGCSARDPIFVLGLQRSGSTLVEQILASHEEIEGTAELIVIPKIWDRIVSEAAAAEISPFERVTQLDRQAIAALGSEYLERTKPFRLTDRPMFVDKLPGNWMNIGLIRLILPNATIIDARRHPMACGFSNFTQHYATGVSFAYSLESIGQFYADYLRLMNHFDRVQPGAIHHVLNERLIDDPEGEVRLLLDHVGLPFDPACLDFHRNTRAVRTPSAEQVRRPINRDGVDSWRRYQAWLDPLEQALGDALHEWNRLTA